MQQKFKQQNFRKTWQKWKKKTQKRNIFSKVLSRHLLREMISHKSKLSEYMRIYSTKLFVRDYFIERQYLQIKDELMWLFAFINVVKEQIIQKKSIL